MDATISKRSATTRLCSTHIPGVWFTGLSSKLTQCGSQHGVVGYNPLCMQTFCVNTPHTAGISQCTCAKQRLGFLQCPSTNGALVSCKVCRRPSAIQQNEHYHQSQVGSDSTLVAAGNRQYIGLLAIMVTFVTLTMSTNHYEVLTSVRPVAIPGT